MQQLREQLLKLLNRFNDIVANEISSNITLQKQYPSIGRLCDIHPASCREHQIQSLFFHGLRKSRYYVHSESLYFYPKSNSRRIDLAVWLGILKRWLYLELEPCTPLSGYIPVLTDAKKYISDRTAHSCDKLKCLLVYGFRDQVNTDHFPRKYSRLSTDLASLGYQEIAIKKKTLINDAYSYILSGLWLFK